MMVDDEPADAGAVRVVETHISTLFFVGDRVYKLRKPVRFGFLDFRERATRQADCHREVELNRRLAPDAYVGVVDLLMDGEPIDHMVVMRRMSDSGNLAMMAARGADLGPWVRQVAEILVAFHQRAERSPEISADATDRAVRKVWEDSFCETQPFVGAVLDDTDELEIRRLVTRWIEGRKPLFDARIASGCACDGHGDLQAEDIFCLEDGVRILDCIEFSDQLRHCDVCSDVTFLAMDLERLGHAEAAAQLLSDYQEIAGVRFPDALVHHYGALHSYVRAKVACLRSAQGADPAQIEARHLQAMTLAHLKRARVRVVLVGGLPGSGKSTLASGLASSTGWTVLRSDQIRQGLRGTVAHEATRPGYGQGRYSPTVTAEVYRELLGQAARALGLGESVILDASWIDVGWRDAAAAIADATSSDLVALRCTADPETSDSRITRRLGEHSDLSEATPEVRLAMGRLMDPWPESDVIDTSETTAEGVVAQALCAVQF